MSKRNIYERFRAHGMTVEGALAMLGNFEAESNCVSCRVQGDFSSGYLSSQIYTEKVDSGSVSREEFVHSGPGGGGYGLAQWTYHTRKLALYNFSLERNVSVGLEDMQIDFAVQELKEDYQSIWNMLCSSHDLHELTRLVCERFENPAVKNTEYRYQAALRIQAELGSEAEPVTDDPAPDSPDEPYWPPRVLTIDMHGADVMILQALLLARGYHCGGVTGIYDNRTRNMVMAFQAESNLEIDGIAGPKTFRALGVTV